MNWVSSSSLAAVFNQVVLAYVFAMLWVPGWLLHATDIPKARCPDSQITMLRDDQSAKQPTNLNYVVKL